MENMKQCSMICLNRIQSAQAEWLWYPYIPLGKITIIQGDPGEGKSTFALHLAAAVTRGVSVEDFTKCVSNPDYVIYQNAEDGLADTVKPRLERAHADCDMVFCLDDTEFPLSITDGRLPMILAEYKPRLLILDPLQAYLGECVDMHRANEVRPVMSCLAALAEQYRCAVILIGHMNKAAGLKSVYRGLGSIDLTAAARSVLLVARDPANPENRVITQIKNSLAPEGEPVAFQIGDDGGLRYLGRYEITEEEMLAQGCPRPRRQDAAEKLILEWLEKAHPLYARDIYSIADSEGITKTSLMRAKKALNIISEKTEQGWIWVGSADSHFPSECGSGAHPIRQTHAAVRGFCDVTAPHAKARR